MLVRPRKIPKIFNLMKKAFYRGMARMLMATAIGCGMLAAGGARTDAAEAQAAVRKPSIRQAKSPRDDAVFQRIRHFRAKLPEQYRKRNNFAWAAAKIEGLDKSEYFAHSGLQDLEGLSTAAADQIRSISLRPDRTTARFKVRCVNQRGQVDGPDCWERDVDTEYKILEDMAARLPDPSAAGSVQLYTDLRPCPSCWGVMQQFLARYFNVHMQVLYRID